MVLWNGVGQVASIAQLAGVDAYGLISMIVEAAQTVKRNQETCQLLARRTKMIGDLLQQLQSTQLMQHTETRIPVEQLEETLRHTYLLMTYVRRAATCTAALWEEGRLINSVRCRTRSPSTFSSSPLSALLTPPVPGSEF